MDIFFSLLVKLIPLYIFILLGFLGGKYLEVKKESVANLVIFLVAPVIFFNGVFTAQISPSSLTLPLLIFALCCILCIATYTLSAIFWKDNTRNTLAFITADGNTGYFGIPVALILFPAHILGLYILASLGVVLYESTLGFFIAAKGQHTMKESLLKLFKLPLIYAVALGLLANVAHMHFGPLYTDAVTNFKGAYTILGMMMIGVGIAGITEYKFDFLFTGFAFFAKFLLWPLLALIVIMLDTHFLKFYNPDAYKILILTSVVPLAANTVSLTTFLKSHPEKVALAVLFSTLFALFYVPLAVTLFIK